MGPWDPRTKGCGAEMQRCQGLGDGGTGLDAGLRVQGHPEMAADGGDMDMVTTRGPVLKLGHTVMSGMNAPSQS